METPVQKVWTASSGEMPWNAPGHLVVDEISRAEAVGPSVSQSGDKVSDRQSARPTTRDRARQETAEFLGARQACAVSGNANPIDLVLSGSRKGDESAKPKEYFSSKKPGHSKGECRYFSACEEEEAWFNKTELTDILARIRRRVRQSFWEKEGRAC